MTLSSTGAKQKPALDEGAFQQLLAAAYTVQQHTNSLTRNDPSGSSQVLSAIAQIQSQIRMRNLNIANGTALIAQQLLRLARANGVSISLVDNGYLDCVAEAGTSATIPGSSVSSHSLVATGLLTSGHMFESENSQTDLRLDSDLCREIGVGSLVAAPVLRFGEIAGLVEVRWTDPHAFGEPELRTCRLMAGLVTGTLERSIRIGNIKTDSLQATVAAVKSQPEESPREPSPEITSPTEDLRTESHDLPENPEAGDQAEMQAASQEEAVTKASPELSCRMCGRLFAADEQFCGFCSMPRPVEHHSDELQSKWASLWFMQQAKEALQKTKTQHLPETTEDKVRFWHDVGELAAASESHIAPVEPKAQMWPRRAPAEITSDQKLVPSQDPVTPEAFPFQEQPPFSERAASFANRHWRDAILATVVLTLTIGVVTAWPRSANQPTWFQSLMVRVWIVQPRTKVFAGAPETRVWIDVHTQLYYCSGEDLYGKTPDGEFTTQYNAQSDGFLPASTTTCP